VFNIKISYLRVIKRRNLKRNINYKSFKTVMPLKEFKGIYYKDYYTNAEEKRMCRFLNIGPGLLDYALRKRRLLHKFIKFKYYAAFFRKQIPNRFYKKKKIHFRRKKRRKNLNLRTQFFFGINYESYLFYLITKNKQFIIKPFNFFASLFFYRTRKFKKLCVIRKRKRRRFRFFYKKKRKQRRKRFLQRRKRKRYMSYRFRKKLFFKRYKKWKVRRVGNFLRFIAFLHVCKKITFTKDENFKVKSIFTLPHKLFKFNFNKIVNSYEFFINIRRRKKRFKINAISIYDKNNFNKALTKLKKKSYNCIKDKLKSIKKKVSSPKINCNLISINLNEKKKLTSSTISYEFPVLFYYNVFYYLLQHLYVQVDLFHSFNSNDSLYDFLSYLYFNLITPKLEKLTDLKLKLIDVSKISLKLPTYFKDNNIFKNGYILEKERVQENQIILVFKSIKKIMKQLVFFQKKLNKIIVRKKKKISLVFLKVKKKKKINKINYKSKKYINILLDIINNLKQKLQYRILNFYIFISKTKEYNLISNKSRIFFKKVKYLIKNANLSGKLSDLNKKFKRFGKYKYRKFNKFYKFKNIKKKKKVFKLISFLYLRKKFLFYKPQKLPFSYTNKINNMSRKRYFKKLRFLKKQQRRKRKKKLKVMNQIALFMQFNLYKNPLNKLKKTSVYYHFCNRKIKYIYLNYFIKRNIKFAKMNQRKKNIKFINDGSY
jgi:hypothetical protein